MAPGRLADEEERQRGLVAERLVERLGEARQQLRRVRLEHDLLVARPVALGDRAREGALVVGRVREADGEGTDRLGACLRHQRDDDRGVDPAREERAERHVRREPSPYRGADGLAHPLEPLRLGRARRRRLRLPPALDALGAALGDEHVARQEALDAEDPGRRAGHVAEREVGVERGEIRLARDPGQLQQRLQLRGEGERPVGQPRPHERLLAEPVAGEHEPLPGPVPEREGEHPVQVLEEAEAVLLVEVREHRRVARAAHLVAPQRLAQLAVVVELAVEDGDDPARLVRNGLAAGLEIEHAQALAPERAPAVHLGRALVGAAVADRRAHRVDRYRIGRAG